MPASAQCGPNRAIFPAFSRPRQDKRRDMRVAVVVLAGGQGRRIGGAKPLRLLGGERLVDRAVARAQRLSGHVALSVGSAVQLPDCGVPQIVDPTPGWGAIGGL